MRMEKTGVAVVTGGAAGIGKAISQRLARDGYVVVVADLNDRSGMETADAICAEGGDALFTMVDVALRASVEALVEICRDRFGQVDILVNNAGIVENADFLSLDEEVWDRTLAVNLKGCFLCSQAFARLMVSAETKGSIINISSVQGVTVWPSAPHAPYEVSKAGIIMLTKQTAFELAKFGIRVNCVAPGPVATEILEPWTSSPEKIMTINNSIPLGRVAAPDEIAGVVSFLSGKDAKYLTGITVFADGGRMTW